VHRDPKPSNILVGDEGEALVADWGLAKLLGQPDAERPPIAVSEWANPADTAQGAIVGTPAYLAPEQWRGATDQVGVRTDVYILGGTLFHILTGRAPWHSADGISDTIKQIIAAHGPPRARAVNPAVPAALDAVCAKAMAHAIEDRYASPSDMAVAVGHWLAGQSASPVRRLVRALWPSRDKG
jgi:serine/threonine protein kinase